MYKEELKNIELHTIGMRGYSNSFDTNYFDIEKELDYEELERLLEMNEKTELEELFELNEKILEYIKSAKLIFDHESKKERTIFSPIPKIFEKYFSNDGTRVKPVPLETVDLVADFLLIEKEEVANAS
jgi:hypothetical protein